MSQSDVVKKTDAIAFIDLQAQRRRLGQDLSRAITEAVEGGAWILGPQVQELERGLAAYAHMKHAVTCANGTDALVLILRAWGVSQGDAVFVPAFTFAASAEVVCLVGATPVFVDVLPDTFNLDPESLKSAIAMIRAEGRLRPSAIMAVDLFGQPADYHQIERIAEQERVKLICDSAQGFGSTLNGKHAVAFGHAAATSFFPAKPLGCYGDGGCCFTNDDGLAETLRSLRVHGQGTDKYQNVRVGLNSRLDTIQAAILNEKLKIFPDEIIERNRVANSYAKWFGQSNRIRVPRVAGGTVSTWAQYTIQVENRLRVQQVLKDQGIPSVVYYPVPLNRQKAYETFPVAPNGVPVSEHLSECVISLPMHPYLSTENVARIAKVVLTAIGQE